MVFGDLFPFTSFLCHNVPTSTIGPFSGIDDIFVYSLKLNRRVHDVGVVDSGYVKGVAKAGAGLANKSE